MSRQAFPVKHAHVRPTRRTLAPLQRIDHAVLVLRGQGSIQQLKRMQNPIYKPWSTCIQALQECPKTQNDRKDKHKISNKRETGTRTTKRTRRKKRERERKRKKVKNRKTQREKSRKGEKGRRQREEDRTKRDGERK